MSVQLNVNDQKVIDYIEKNGNLCQKGHWNIYLGDYNDEYSDLGIHFSSHGDNCNVVKGDNITIDEARRGRFLDTFSGSEDLLVMEVQGYGCACGKYEIGELGYYIKESFSNILLDIIGLDVNVNFKHDFSW